MNNQVMLFNGNVMDPSQGGVVDNYDQSNNQYQTQIPVYNQLNG